jgi:arabinoxylan arabinofuranohydrolase
MKKKMLILMAIVLTMVFESAVCLADNPIVQTIYTADPAPLVYDGTCYVYTSHDEDNIVNNFYTMNDWRCYSTKDMVNWTDHGSPLSYNTFSWAQGDAWACQVVPANGKFYLYAPMTRKNSGGARTIGVAVSDSPTGPFVDALGKPLIANNGAEDIDPTVFIDDDGQAYLYWGNGNLYYVKLNKDMISYSGGINKMKPTNFVEGPWFYKRNNLYYMVYAGMGSGNEDIRYATSSSPTGPWNYRGVIMGSQNSFTNHPGVCDFGGNSYFFYHTGNLPGGGSYHRSVCVEQFKYNSDGTIPTIQMTKNGPDQIGSLDPYVKNEAETICWESGIETEKCSEGGMNVANIENGDYIKVKGVDFGSGASSFEARVASANNGGKIELRLDSETGTLIGTLEVSGTGGWQTWTTKSCTVSGAKGKHDLYLKFTGGSGYLFNVNWWKFNSDSESPTITVPPTATIPPTPTISPTGKRNAYAKIEAESYDSVTATNLRTVDGANGGSAIGYINNGDYVVYEGVNFGTGATTFKALVADTMTANVELRLNSPTGKLIGTLQVTSTGDWSKYEEQTCNVDKVSGVYDLYLVFSNSVNVDSFTFEGGTIQQDQILGDLNGDKEINSIDFGLFRKHLLGITLLEGTALSNADVNKDGKADAIDFGYMRKYMLGIITSFDE